MFTCDTGGELNVVTHLYAYESMAAREVARAAAAKDAQWVAYVDAGRQHMQKQVGRARRGGAGGRRHARRCGRGGLVRSWEPGGVLPRAKASMAPGVPPLQASRIMLEATGLYTATGAPGAAAFVAPSGAPGMYELRQYQLHPGYGSVPKLLKAFEEGWAPVSFRWLS
jgi:hypothetical protein